MMHALEPTDPILRKKLPVIPRKDIRMRGTQKTISELLDFFYGRNEKKKGKLAPKTIGLSANQVGIQKRICIVDFSIRRKNAHDVHVFINPEIVWHSKTIIRRREGCVNLPLIWGIVPRYKSVIVEALDRWGNEYVIKATGWNAILLQHEIDHLNGHLLIDHLEDPTKAHFVKDEDVRRYRKEHRQWKQLIDVSKWVRK